MALNNFSHKYEWGEMCWSARPIAKRENFILIDFFHYIIVQICITVPLCLCLILKITLRFIEPFIV